MPTWDEIHAAITPDHLQKIKEHIPNPHLLIVPIGMPLEKTAQKVGAKKGKLPKQETVYTQNWDIKADLPNRKKDEEALRYFVEDYTESSGISKSDFLKTNAGLNRFPGWQVLVVSGDKKVDPKTLSKSSRELQHDAKSKGLYNLVPDEWLLWHGDNVRDGVPADVWQENSGTWNGGAFLTKSKSVPSSGWGTAREGAFLRYSGPDARLEDLGGRPAVRIF